MRRLLRDRLPDPASIMENRWLGPFRHRLAHPRLWHLSRHSVASGVAIGLLCGLIPGPFQMLGAALLAVGLRANLPLAVLVTLYTNPFTIIPIYLLAYRIGRVVLNDDSALTLPPSPEATGLGEWSMALVQWGHQVSVPLACGLLTLGLALAALAYAGIHAGWRIHLRHRWKNRHRR